MKKQPKNQSEYDPSIGIARGTGEEDAIRVERVGNHLEPRRSLLNLQLELRGVLLSTRTRAGEPIPTLVVLVFR